MCRNIGMSAFDVVRDVVSSIKKKLISGEMAKWVYLSTRLRSFTRPKPRERFRRLVSFFTRVRDGFISDLVSKWGVCFGVREHHALNPYTV